MNDSCPCQGGGVGHAAGFQPRAFSSEREFCNFVIGERDKLELEGSGDLLTGAKEQSVGARQGDRLRPLARDGLGQVREDDFTGVNDFALELELAGVAQLPRVEDNDLESFPIARRGQDPRLTPGRPEKEKVWRHRIHQRFVTAHHGRKGL